MPRKPRNYAGEYKRRLRKWLSRGFSRSQARGHPRPGEAGLTVRRRPTSLDDQRLQLALRVLRQEKSLAAAAKAARVSPERLKHAAAAKDAILKERRRWVLNPDLPRRMLIYSRRQAIQITVGDQASASLVGRYMAAVGKFLVSNDQDLLQPFIRQSVIDSSGKSHPLETNPNTLYRLISGGGETFEAVYRIVV
jgi:hypothetical protein